MKKLIFIISMLFSISLYGGTLFSVGPSAGLITSELGTGFAGTLDLTFAYSTVGKWPVKNQTKKNMASVFWLSIGTRGQYINQWIISPYIECGLWIFANIGVGYTYQIDSAAGYHIVHLFIGVPLPIDFSNVFGTPFYFEPYYRPGWIVNNNGVMIHDVGLLIKFVINLDSV